MMKRLLLMLCLVAPVAYAQGPVVNLVSGEVRGISGFGSNSFLGIPFAAAPVGELRWHEPMPVKTWRGVRAAEKSGPACPALISGDGLRSETEDCLYLNVYAPKIARKGTKLPVMVFFHGGANLWGSTAIYDGMRMAEVTHAIVVMPAYRLGVFGLLAAPGMDADAGDFMLEDQVAALRWVKENVAAFGGNPADVTISGQSAGSMDMCTELASPASKGLQRQAILQSGACQHGVSQAEAMEDGKAFATKLGCTSTEALSCLRAKPVRAILDGWSGGRFGKLGISVYGTKLLPEPADVAIADGHFTHVPLLIGFTRDEMWPFQHGLYPLSSEGLQKQFELKFGTHATEVSKLYPEAEYPHREYALGAAVGDQFMACSSLKEAAEAEKWTPVSVYEFADRTVPPFRSLGSEIKRPEGYHPGAFHTAELQYLYAYQSAEGPLSAEQKRFADKLMQFWVGFGRQKPSAFPAFDAKKTVLVLGEHGESITPSGAVYDAHHCSFWNSLSKPE
ncbi:MAG: carboxylesterase family protein [Acidobacteriaceae bacterium]|nr:carboxylesterase family protein [Acidobacteriaceae bacterium]